ncbi:MAG: hypothetical protein GXY52_09060 [Chloroflexi bacterium]|nr:hypothetical protein [Chloroflexota bacterium]
MSRWQRPTIDTKFHIDLQWWQSSQLDLRFYIREAMCSSCQADFGNLDDAEQIDWVDEVTGEVTTLDGVWQALRAHCVNEPNFIDATTPIVDAVFRTFLANGNQPLSIVELHALLDRRSPETLLRMLIGGQVYLGIRPVL